MTAKKHPKTTKNTKAPNTPKKPKATTPPDQPVQTSAPDTPPVPAPKVRQPADLEKIQALAERQGAVANDLRVQQGKSPVEFEFCVLPVEAVQPSQSGEDYDNARNQELAQHIGVFGTSGREADYAPIAVDEDGRIIDGHHRHAAYVAAGFTHLPILVPKVIPSPTEAATQPEPPVTAKGAPLTAGTTDHPEAPDPAPTAPAEVPVTAKAKRPRNAKTKSAKAAGGQKLSALDAAAKVLGEEGRPMNCRELIGTMAIKGYWSSPGGQTPDATLYSALLREVTTKGDLARFRKTGPGHFALRSAD